MKIFRNLIGLLLLVLVLVVVAPAAFFNHNITPKLIESQLVTINTLSDDLFTIKMVSFKQHFLSTEVHYEVSPKNIVGSNAPVAEIQQTIEPGWFPLSRLSHFQLKPVLAYNHFVLQSRRGISTTLTIDNLVHLNKSQSWMGRLSDIHQPDLTIKNLHFSYEGSGVYLRPNVTEVQETRDAFMVTQDNSQQTLSLALDQLLLYDHGKVEIQNLSITSNGDSEQKDQKVSGHTLINTNIASLLIKRSSLSLSAKNLSNTWNTRINNLDVQLIETLRSSNPIQVISALMRIPTDIQFDTRFDQLNIDLVDLHDEANLNFKQAQLGLHFVQGQPNSPLLHNTFMAQEYQVMTSDLKAPRSFHALHLDWSILADQYQTPYQLTLKDFSVRNANDEPLLILNKGHALLNRRMMISEGSLDVENRMRNAQMYADTVPSDALVSNGTAASDDQAALSALLSLLHVDKITEDPEEQQKILKAIDGLPTHFVLSMHQGEEYLNDVPVSRSEASYLMLISLFWRDLLLPGLVD